MSVCVPSLPVFESDFDLDLDLDRNLYLDLI